MLVSLSVVKLKMQFKLHVYLKTSSELLIEELWGKAEGGRHFQPLSAGGGGGHQKRGAAVSLGLTETLLVGDGSKHLVGRVGEKTFLERNQTLYRKMYA